MATSIPTEELPNGPVAAAMIAGGIGATALGVITTIYDLSDPKGAFATSLVWNKGVGALSGKTSLAVIIFFVSWAVLHFIFRGKNTNMTRAVTIALVLLAVGLITTFPPFWDMLKGG